MGRARRSAADRRAGDVAGGEGGAGIRPVAADPAFAGGGRRRQRAAQREGRGVLPLPGDGRGAADGVPGVRGGPGDAEVPLPGGGVRAGLRGPGGVSARRRVEGRGLRAGRARRPGGERPAHLRADAVGEPVVEAGLRAARRAGADQRAARQQLRVRAPLRARAGEDEGAAGAGAGGDDGAGAGLGRRGPARAHALAGGTRECRWRRSAAATPSRDGIDGRSRDARAHHPHKWEWFSSGRPESGPEAAPGTPGARDPAPTHRPVRRRERPPRRGDLAGKPYSASPSAGDLPLQMYTYTVSGDALVGRWKN